MTTIVRIGAHLASQKEVVIKVIEGGNIVEEFTLQDGESAERYVYDDREINVKEVVK